MSNAGTNIELEDVLASIRRLVSQDTSVARVAPGRPSSPAPEVVAPLRPLSLAVQALTRPTVMQESVAEASVPAVDEPATGKEVGALAEDATPVGEPLSAVVDLPVDATVPPPEVDYLVLTPAFRVEPEDAAAEPEADVPEPDAASLVAELNRLESTIAQLEAAVARSDEHFEPDAGEQFPAAAIFEGILSAEDLPAFVGTDMPPAFGDAAPEDMVSEDVSDVTFAGAAVSGRVEDLPPEPFEDQVTEVLADDRPAEPAPALADPDLYDVAWAEDAAPESWSAEGWAEDEAPAALAEAEAALAAEANTPRRLHLSDAEERISRPEILRSSYHDLREELALDDEEDLQFARATAPQDDALLDGDALRELVAQLIREELRGVLGERITSNVRRLVRREIQRALLSPEIEE